MVDSESRPLVAFDWTTFNSVCTAIVEATADVADENPLELPPLHNVVDPDSLDGFFERRDGEPTTATGTIQFEYADYLVVIEATGRGYIYPRGLSARVVESATLPVVTAED